jgi:hypothetical protein
MSEPREAKTRSRLCERGGAKDRRSRPRVRAVADTQEMDFWALVIEAADGSRLRGGRHLERGMSSRRKEAEA